MSPGDRQPVRVMIFGEEYQIRTDLGEEYTKTCAQYVDDAIQEAHVGGHVSEPHRAAILAALKITDELFRARAEAAQVTENVRARVEALAERLEQALRAGAESVDEGADATELALDV